MKKIPTIFKRNPNKRSLVLNEINPICQWVFDGAGCVVRKYDGTACMIKDGILYKRRTIRYSSTPPVDFTQVDIDLDTGKRFGWQPISDRPEDIYHREAFGAKVGKFKDGTYELLGPKIQGNPEFVECHVLLPHSLAPIYCLSGEDRTFKGIKDILMNLAIEGFIFKNAKGEMAKIKKSDFGLSRELSSDE